MSDREQELERIRSAYATRDAGPRAAAAWPDPGYRFYMQRLEALVLDALQACGVRLDGARVLEVGCGSGYFTHRFLEYGAAQAAGIDLMEERVREARERYPRLELRAGDASELPWPAESFDVVAQFTCLSSILDPALRSAVASEMWRVLAPGGAIVSFDMVRPHRVLRVLRRLRAGGAKPQGATATTEIELDDLTRLFPHGAGRHTGWLGLDAAGLARRHVALAGAASLVPLLRTHLLFAARKQPG